MKKKNGITLIALVITVIILLILAGISLSLIAGGNGILNKAQKAIETTNKAAILEEVQLIISEGRMQYYLDIKEETLTEYLANNYSGYKTGSGAIIDFNQNGEITYTKNKNVVVLEMDKNGNVEIIQKTTDLNMFSYTIEWNNNIATINVTSSIPGLQYKINEEDGWRDYLENNKPQVESGEIVNFRVIEGTNIKIYDSVTPLIEKTIIYYANDKNEGDGNVPPNQKIEHTKTAIVDFSKIPTRPGYIFLGWATDTNAELPTYTLSGTKSFTMEKDNVELYAVWKEPLAKKITENDFGKTINYSANGITDWKVFYNDGTNVFIIASDYLPIEKVPTSQTEITTKGVYTVYWEEAPNYQPIKNDTLSLFKATGYTLNSNHENSKCVSTLLNTDNWISFVDTNKASCAIGSPTLEMLVASWNAKGYTNLYCNYITDYGYGVGTSSSSTSTWLYLNSSPGYRDSLYYPHTSSYNCYGYWLASPSASASSAQMIMLYDGRMDYHSPVGVHNPYAIRPVVCLKSEVTGNIGETVTMD